MKKWMRYIGIAFPSIIVVAAGFWMLSSGNTSPVQIKSLHDGWQFRQAETEQWHEAKVPGNVHQDLYRNQMIPNPFVGLNEDSVQWVGDSDWEYRTTFQLTEVEAARTHKALQFDGLDTRTQVSVNGKVVRFTDNMFRRWNLSVDTLLKPGNNEVSILFHSPTKWMAEKASTSLLSRTAGNDADSIRVSPFVRKAAFHFGWDWSPRLVTCGVWRPVRLKLWDQGILEDTEISADIESNTGKVYFSLDRDPVSNLGMHLALDVLDPAGKLVASRTIELDNASEHQTNREFVEVSDPELWWPRNKGSQPLYTAEMKLMEGGVEIDHYRRKIGFRKIELVREKDEIGESFYFKVNGKEVFVRGANYIPQDQFRFEKSQITAREIVQEAANANMNMLRVWGGGIYESDQLYNQCDSLGLLVWQDFMFACMLYPRDDQFMKMVTEEVEDNVARLNHHPSIALWCGNNEVDVAWKNWGWQEAFEISKQDQKEIEKKYNELFKEIIPTAIKRHDVQRPYVHTSPLSNWGNPENFNAGSMHYWGVWHGGEFIMNYRLNVPRFMSEYGFQSFPEKATIAVFADSADQDLRSPIMSHHQKSYIGNGEIARQMGLLYGIPTDFDNFIYLSQLLQADALRMAIESHRLARPHCMGTMFWQLNDVWPGPSWSVIDVYGRRKAGWYMTKRMYSDVIAIPKGKGEQVSVTLLNETAQPVSGTVTLKAMQFDGKELYSDSIKVTLQPDQVMDTLVKKITDLMPLNLLRQACVVVSFENAETQFSEIYQYFGPPQMLKWEKPTVNWEAEAIGDAFQLTLQSPTLARSVALALPGQKTFFSDNYFDLIGTRKVSLEAPGLSLEQVKNSLQIRTMHGAAAPILR